jgi:hypothetical protein
MHDECFQVALRAEDACQITARGSQVKGTAGQEYGFAYRIRQRYPRRPFESRAWIVFFERICRPISIDDFHAFPP